MKKVVVSLLLALPIFFLMACENKTTEKVVSSYENGQPSKVQLLNSKGMAVREIEYYEDGMVKMEGGMKNGKREGEWKAYFPDGKVQSEGIFKDGLRTGKATVYHENGQLYMEGNYKEGHHCGKWTYYDEQGYALRTDDYGE